MTDVELERMIAETRKFAAEQNKLAEAASKFRREPWLLLAVALAALIGTLLGSLPNLLTVLLRSS